MIKAMANAALAVFGVTGFIITLNDGPFFPVVNFLGLALMFISALVYLKIKNELF